jgi:hypothetical protein
MHVGCLGRPLRPPRWAARRTRWRNHIRAFEVAAALIAVLVASDIGIERLLRSSSNAYTARPSDRLVTVLPPDVSTSRAEIAARNTAANDEPRPTIIAPSAAANLIISPKPNRMVARLRSISERHRPILAVQGPVNWSTRADAAAVHYCGLHSSVRESGCHQEGAHRQSSVTLPPS